MAVLERLWDNDQAAYLVGGGVRDALLGLPVTDWDVATDARPERIMEVFPGGSYRNRFGTVSAEGLEITTFRRDHRYADHRRPESVTFSRDVHEDLARRDLTINAIAWGGPPRAGGPGFVDPFEGRGDLAARIVRAVGEPDERFEEDALRPLRAIRIATRLDFSIEPGTRSAIVAHAQDVAWVSAERIAGEVRRMLAVRKPSRAIELLRETGILAVILPELLETQQPVERAPEAPLARSLVELDIVVTGRAGDERLALAALFGQVGAATARGALERLRFPSRQTELVCALIDAVSVPYAAGWSDADVRRYMARLPAGLIEDVIMLRGARAAGAIGSDPAREEELATRMREQAASEPPLALSDLAVDGRDLQVSLGLPEGPLIGTILERLLDEVLEEPSLNDRHALLARAQGLVVDLADGGPAIG
jgi:tRNA nucleotidyltransferase/poly(A) polymerase